MKYIQPLGAEENAEYIQGDPAIGVEGSYIPADAFNHTIAEIVNVISSAGFVPIQDVNSQMLQVIEKVASNIQIEAGPFRAETLRGDTASEFTLRADKVINSKLLNNAEVSIAADPNTIVQRDNAGGVSVASLSVTELGANTKTVYSSLPAAAVICVKQTGAVGAPWVFAKLNTILTG